jgi:L-asparaginase
MKMNVNTNAKTNMKMKRKKILIFHTGGTIGMIEGGVKALTPSTLGTHFLRLVPELSQLARVSVKVLDNIDSSNVSPEHWIKWFTNLKEVYHDFDGFVFTHGTDTMAYTASALSFALRKVSKPVVFTGSQRPLLNIRTDARDNLINAVEMAINGPVEVSLCFGNKLLRANRAIKFSSTDYVAFESFNFPALANLGVGIDANWKGFSNFSKVKTGAPLWKLSFNKSVFCFKLFPGISTEILRVAVNSPSSSGIVLEAYGSGNMPVISDSVLSAVELATNLGKPVVVVSQCPHGHVDLSLYESGVRAQKLGAISAGDMTSEATIVKLMHALSLNVSYARKVSFFKENVAGERSF